MSQHSYRFAHRSRVHNGFIKLDLYDVTITAGGRTVTMMREVHDHGNGALVLPFDEARRTCLLVRQLRLPVEIAAPGTGLLLEAAAGLIDPTDPTPADAARREAAEELGFAVTDLEKVATFYPIPGLVTEMMHCFIARYTADGRVTGVAQDADEVIDVEEWRLADLWQAWEDGVLTDGKTAITLQALRLRRPDLFAA